MVDERFIDISNPNLHGVYVIVDQITGERLNSMEILIDTLNQLHNENQKQEYLIGDLLYQIEYAGLNNKPCKNCISHLEDINYCTMYDMTVKEDEIVIKCEHGKWGEK